LYAARGRYFDLYTKQHGLEANLFLAPGEGDEVAESEPSAEQKAASGLSEAMRLIRG